MKLIWATAAAGTIRQQPTTATMFVLLVLFAAATEPCHCQTTTIPCPGAVDPELYPFYNTPLADRPNLARILQHGYKLSRQVPTLPTTTSPGNSVAFHQGFVDRPFRSISQEHCYTPMMANPEENIRCVSSPQLRFESSGTTSLDYMVEEQVVLQSGAEARDYVPASSVENMFDEQMDSWQTWRDETISMLADEFDCEYGYFFTYSSQYSCVVQSEFCQRLDPEFLGDLQALPAEPIPFQDEDATEWDAYRAFVDKWGYGTIDEFRLGATNLHFESNQEGGPDTKIWMGNLGGSGISNALDGDSMEGPLYTADECLDPQPGQVVYKRWSDFLVDDTFFRIVPSVKNETEPLVNRTEIQENFARFYLMEFYSLRQQLRDSDANLTDLECTVESSNNPTTPPSEAPSTSPPTASPTSTSTSKPSVDPTSSGGTSSTTITLAWTISSVGIILSSLVM